MYAVVKTGGKQIKVEEGAEVVVEKLDAEVGDTVDFDVLFFSDGSKTVVDPVAVRTGAVTAEVVEQFKGDKVVVFKFKRRKGYKRTRGHRQQMTRVKVTKIAAPKAGAKKASAKPKAEPVEKPAEAAKPAAKEAPAKEAPPQEPVAKPASVEPAAEVAEPAAEPGQCEAITASGERCKNKAKEGSKYCGVHAKKYEG